MGKILDMRKNNIFINRFFNLLPKNTEFTTLDAINIGNEKMFICERTCSNYLKILSDDGLLVRPRWGKYKKL
ncbi:MAG: hypothetical protein ACOC3V_05880 [bacterium]